MIKYERKSRNEQIFSKITVNGKVIESFVDDPEDKLLLVQIWDYL